VTLAIRGLLIEEQRTNLLLQSAAFDNASWTKTNATVTANNVNAPDGATTAEMITDSADGAATSHSVNQSINFTSGTAYTLSVFAKQGTLAGSVLLFPSAAFTSNITARFDLSAGTVAATDAGVAATISAVGNGWYRCTATATATATAAGLLQIRTATAASSFYQGAGAGAIYIWGAQLEAGSSARTYIPTTTASATRAVDSAQFTIPSGVVRLTYTFDDNSTQNVAVTAGSYTIPTTLNRQRIRTIAGWTT
jgi:hypothetical protein